MGRLCSSEAEVLCEPQVNRLSVSPLTRSSAPDSTPRSNVPAAMKIMCQSKRTTPQNLLRAARASSLGSWSKLFPGFVVASRKLVGVIDALVVFLDGGQRTGMGVENPIAHQLIKIGDVPRCRIHFGIVEGKHDLQSVVVNALPALGLMHGLAERKTLPGQKLLAVVAARIDDERVAIPLADRVPHVVWLQIVWESSSIRPNFPPVVVVLEVLQKSVAGRDIFERPGRKEIAGGSVGIAVKHGAS